MLLGVAVIEAGNGIAPEDERRQWPGARRMDRRQTPRTLNIVTSRSMPS
jgi:hypothetical protein